MLKALWNWLFGRKQVVLARVPTPAGGPSVPTAPIDQLNRQAPLQAAPAPSPQSEMGPTFICREAILSRQQKIAGYHFLLQESARNRIRNSSRRVHHLYAEILVSSLVKADIGKLLGARLAFVDLPDSFLDHPCIRQLPPRNTVLVIQPHPEADGPGPETLMTHVRSLKSAGYRIGVPDPISTPQLISLLPEADVVVVRAPQLDAEQALSLSTTMLEKASQAALLARDLPGLEDFRFCFQLGCSLFQGPFITSREDWRDRNLGPNTARLAELVSKLRKDADSAEIVALLKHDAALTVRLLRYINAAANGLSEQVSSVERAFALLGREKLYRWVTLLLCSADHGGERSSAALESALIRARMLELLAAERSPTEREALFLTGLISLIDVILEVPMERALTLLAVAPDIEAALLRGQGPLASRLALAQACERSDADAIRSAAETCGVTPEFAAQCHFDALAWALSLQQES
ncbi:EAL and HDOD domain-containing protein [Parazoarcus communis]|uniref:Signal transduction protein n=1 Tax=Parazoarcus communis SWub3 = DSM 12120 TaxID=1121029 RepID=A0A323USN7_9RHOO|nr:HDOD domain-containing protein [Parazoarcus communis]NMG71281.1 HDOD domain-containing protein [Parazoarcus communis SWub3 = DSM 12120]PZA15043.1 signal transduction protein [Azoarcus communis] [Parazoarcus communis SWub3 = DSM 12120]